MGIFLILLVALVPLLVVPGLPEAYLTPKIVALVSVLDFALLWSVVKFWRRGIVCESGWGVGSLANVLKWAVPAYLLVFLIATRGGESLTWGSLLRANGWWIWAHVIGGTVVTVHLCTAVWRARIIRAVAGMGTIVAVLGWIGTLAPKTAIIGFTGSMVATWGNASFLAGMLLATIAATAIAIENTRGRVRGAWIAAILVQISALVATDSRAGLLAFVVGTVVAAMWVLAHRDRRTATWIGSIVVGIVVLFIAVQLMPTSWGIPRALQIAPSAVTSQTRLLQWRSAWEGIKERPWFGWGRGGYATVFAKYFDPQSLVYAGSDAFNDEAHNVVLMTAVEMGLVGLLFWIILYGALTLAAWRVSPSLAGLAVGYVVYLCFTPEQPAVAVYFWIVLVSGVLSTHTRAMVASSRRTQRIFLGAAAFVLVGSLSLVWQHTSALRAFDDAETARLNGRWFAWAQIVGTVANDTTPLACQLWEKVTQTWLGLSDDSSIPTDLRVTSARGIEGASTRCTHDKNLFYRTYLLAQFDGVQAAHIGNEWIGIATSTFAQAQALAPRHPFPAYAESQFLVSVNRIPEAIARLESVRADAPQVRETYLYLYLVYRIAGQQEKAEAIRREGEAHGAKFPSV